MAICGRDQEGLDAAAEQLGAGDELLALPCDVTDPGQLAQLAAGVLERFGGLEGLVNNAGRSAAKPVTETTDEDWDEDLDLKLLSVVRLTRLLAPALADSGRGSIVNVLAIQGKAPGASTTPTSVSRAAGLALTKAMSFDLGPRGIRAEHAADRAHRVEPVDQASAGRAGPDRGLLRQPGRRQRDPARPRGPC